MILNNRVKSHLLTWKDVAILKKGTYRSLSA